MLVPLLSGKSKSSEIIAPTGVLAPSRLVVARDQLDMVSTSSELDDQSASLKRHYSIERHVGSPLRCFVTMSSNSLIPSHRIQDSIPPGQRSHLMRHTSRKLEHEFSQLDMVLHPFPAQMGDECG